jgi:hypothetical protein
MRKRLTTLATRLLALVAVVPLAFAFVAPASAAGGESTPGVTVTAMNPGTSPADGNLKISLTAHTGQSPLENPSCRPEDMTLECWGSLVLRIPQLGGLSVANLEVHRVAVGDTSCGDEGDEGGCEGEPMSVTATGADEAVEAQVNGVAVLVKPGSSGYPAGTKVQVKIALTDNGPGLYVDQVDVQINKFEPGPVKPLITQTGPQVVQQVRIHYTDDTD